MDTIEVDNETREMLKVLVRIRGNFSIHCYIEKDIVSFEIVIATLKYLAVGHSNNRFIKLKHLRISIF